MNNLCQKLIIVISLVLMLSGCSVQVVKLGDRLDNVEQQLVYQQQMNEILIQKMEQFDEQLGNYWI